MPASGAQTPLTEPRPEGPAHDAMPMTDPAAAIHAFLDRIAARRLETADNKPLRLLVAISGGSDSTGLLLLLHRALASCSDTQISLQAATIDHALRPGSAEEAQGVADLCAHLGIAQMTRRWDGDKPSTGLAARARAARYRLLAEIAEETGCTAILTGHTADDQAETIAMRAARARPDPETGSHQSAPGLSGMAQNVLYENNVWIYRPLLASRRQAIRDCLRAQGQDWIDDPSNDNPAYERARIRADLARSLGDTLPQTGRIDRLELSRQAADLLNRHATMPVPGLFHLDTALFEAEGAALRHGLHALVATVGGQPHGPESAALGRLLQLGRQPPGVRLTLGRCLVHRHRSGVFLVREARALPHLLIYPSETAIWDGRWRVTNMGKPIAEVCPAAPDQPLQTAETLPASLAALALMSEPMKAPNLEVEPVIAPYQGFLPGFDLPLAQALADLFRARRFLSPCF